MSKEKRRPFLEFSIRRLVGDFLYFLSALDDSWILEIASKRAEGAAACSPQWPGDSERLHKVQVLLFAIVTVINGCQTRTMEFEEHPFLLFLLLCPGTLIIALLSPKRMFSTKILHNSFTRRPPSRSNKVPSFDLITSSLDFFDPCSRS